MLWSITHYPLIEDRLPGLPYLESIDKPGGLLISHVKRGGRGSEEPKKQSKRSIQFIGNIHFTGSASLSPSEQWIPARGADIFHIPILPTRYCLLRPPVLPLWRARPEWFFSSPAVRWLYQNFPPCCRAIPCIDGMNKSLLTEHTLSFYRIGKSCKAFRAGQPACIHGIPFPPVWRHRDCPGLPSAYRSCPAWRCICHMRRNKARMGPSDFCLLFLLQSSLSYWDLVTLFFSYISCL